MLLVRFATLADTLGIHEVHRSDVKVWHHRLTEADGSQRRVEAEWRDCSLLDRWEHGGAWMSPELCAIHLNRLLLQGHIPLVAELNGKIVGELELILGDDPLYGYNANLSVMYIHADYRGQGVGTLMMQDALELLGQIGCTTLTTYDPAAATFYEKFSMQKEMEYYQVNVNTQPPQTSPLRVRTVSLRRLWQTRADSALFAQNLLSGRIVSQTQLLQLLSDEEDPGEYAIDFNLRPKEMSFVLQEGSEKSLCVLRDRTGLYDTAAVHLWGRRLTAGLIAAVLRRAQQLRINHLAFSVRSEDLALFEPFTDHIPTAATSVYVLHLAPQEHNEALA
ncbi:MAG: GNAT family N-acetyltransferase [Negativicutes bacterium]|nr:GNAT family N-acetyltransferase [Negativicutes bacterium]